MADTVDARIPLGYQFPQLPTAQSLAELKRLQYGNELAQLQVQDAQQQAAQKNALLDVFKQPGALDQQTGLPTPATIARVSEVNPEAGMQLQNNLAKLQASKQEAMTQFLHQKMLGLQINGNQADKLTDIATQAQVRYDALVKQGVNPQEAAKVVSDERNNSIDDAVKDGTLLPEQGRNLRLPFDPNVNRAFIAGSKQYQAVLKEQNDAQRTKVQQDREDRLAASAERSAENSGKTSFMREAEELYGKDTPEYKKALADHVGKQSTAAGAGNFGGRESVFVSRVLSSAGLAMRDIGNIARGPVSQSTGIFGGRSQGPGLLDATKEQLANKITSQEAQTYNVKIAGLQRNLATLESQGLAPNGSLTHQMDAVVFKEGDSNLTKAYKLAEARQIVEGAMEVVQNNERVPKSLRDLADKTIADVQKAVPYSIEDLDNFDASNKKDAKIGDFVKNRAAAAGPGQVARPKSKAEYDALPPGTRVILPNGKEGVKPGAPAASTAAAPASGVPQ